MTGERNKETQDEIDGKIIKVEGSTLIPDGKYTLRRTSKPAEVIATVGNHSLTSEEYHAVPETSEGKEEE